MHKKCAIYHILLNFNIIDDFSSRISTSFCTVFVEKFTTVFLLLEELLIRKKQRQNLITKNQMLSRISTRLLEEKLSPD